MERPSSSPFLIIFLSFLTGATVANLYYNQPILVLMAHSLHVHPGIMGSIPTLTQSGYALGLLLFVPLGDVLRRHRLISVLMIITAVFLATLALASNLWLALTASFFLGMATTVPQIIVPLAADLASDGQRGRVVGIVMSGLLIGVLSARTISGALASALGWRFVFMIAAILMLSLGLVSLRLIPNHKSHQPFEGYRALFESLFEIIRSEPVVWRAALTGAGLFGAFSAFWTSITFLLSGPPFHFPPAVIGLFGLAGIFGALAAQLAGRIADHRPPHQVVFVGLLIGMTALCLLFYGKTSLWALVVGIILLDLGVNGAHIANQTRVFAVRPQARSRLNTIYMTAYFIGGAAGSALGSLGWQSYQWTGVIGAAFMFLLAGLIIHLTGYRTPTDAAKISKSDTISSN